MRQTAETTCNRSNYIRVGCFVSDKRHLSRKRYSVDLRYAKLYEAIEKARWKRNGLFNFPKRKQIVVELPPENIAAISLLQSWRNEDKQEQRETWEFLKQAIDEDRLSDRKLFP